MTAYYMVVDTSGNVLSEGPVNGATPVTAPGPQSSEAFVEVFVKPDPNYLIIRIESADVNNFIYPLGDNYMGRPGQYLKKSDVQRMKDQGYVATFGWGAAYQKEGNNLTVDAKAIQPVPEAKIVPDKTQDLKKRGCGNAYGDSPCGRSPEPVFCRVERHTGSTYRKDQHHRHPAFQCEKNGQRHIYRHSAVYPDRR